MAAEPGGCYGDCYAAKTAKLYGHDFGKTVLRDFESGDHANSIIRRINKSSAHFVRIGCSGDPSENWDHCLKILFQIEWCNKEIIIITRHWTLLTNAQLEYLSGLNICINTSVSAMDKPEARQRSLDQYERIKPFCKSVLRIVSADFNLGNERGHLLAKIQARLFKNDSTIDTVFRPGKRNQFVTAGVINVQREVFNGRKATVSKYNPTTYIGKCAGCTEQCGVNVGANHRNRPGLKVQADMFRSLLRSPRPRARLSA
jgi:hypothetical protein